jgi:hypothetical protein
MLTQLAVPARLKAVNFVEHGEVSIEIMRLPEQGGAGSYLTGKAIHQD